METQLNLAHGTKKDRKLGKRTKTTTDIAQKKQSGQ